MLGLQARAEQAPYPTAQPNGAGIGQASVRESPTLARAITSTEDLNKRLLNLRSRLVEIAEALGGPIPMPGSDANKPPGATAFGRLNDNLDGAHNLVTEIDAAVGGIARSLGG